MTIFSCFNSTSVKSINRLLALLFAVFLYAPSLLFALQPEYILVGTARITTPKNTGNGISFEEVALDSDYLTTESGNQGFLFVPTQPNQVFKVDYSGEGTGGLQLEVECNGFAADLQLFPDKISSTTGYVRNSFNPSCNYTFRFDVKGGVLSQCFVEIYYQIGS